MNGKTCIVTGGSAGLGYETARELALAGAHVLVASRNEKKCKDAINNIHKDVRAKGSDGKAEYLYLDLNSLRGVQDAAKRFKDRGLPLHLLVNNAGTVIPKTAKSEDGIEVTMATNHFGPWLFTQELLEPLKATAPSRIVFVSSLSELSANLDLNNITGEGRKSDLAQYARSKLCNLLTVKELQKRIAGSGVEVFAAQPGVSRTDVFKKIDWWKPSGFILGVSCAVIGITERQGSKPIVHAATSPVMDGHGGDLNYFVGPFYFGGPELIAGEGWAGFTNMFKTGFFHPGNAMTRDDEAAKRLYDTTADIVEQKLRAGSQNSQGGKAAAAAGARGY